MPAVVLEVLTEMSDMIECCVVAVTCGLVQHSLELVYTALCMILATAALLLAKWSIRNLLIFIFLCATLLVCAKAAKAIIDLPPPGPGSYTVQVPV